MEIGTSSEGKKIFSVKVPALSALMAKAVACKKYNAEEILFVDAVGTMTQEGLVFSVEMTTVDNKAPCATEKAK